MSFLSTPPAGLTRRLLATPLWLYRLHVGWLLGHRFARLTHRGRRTGRLHQTVIEVLRFDPMTHEVVAAAGWGGRTDWYRNIHAEPPLEIRTGGVAYRPTVRFLPRDEMIDEFQGYLRRHPRLPRRLVRRLFGVPANVPDSELWMRVDALVKGVSFRPLTEADRHDVAPGGQPAGQRGPGAHACLRP